MTLTKEDLLQMSLGSITAGEVGTGGAGTKDSRAKTKSDAAASSSSSGGKRTLSPFPASASLNKSTLLCLGEMGAMEMN